MSVELLEKKFAQMGAKAKITTDVPSKFGHIITSAQPAFDINVVDGQFRIYAENPDNVQVLDVQPKDRHLLLMVKLDRTNIKFLCGHDERDWFTSGVSGTGPISTVQQAKDSLMPSRVRDAQKKAGVRTRKRHNRHTSGSHRQGEWFFTPAPDFVPDKNDFIHNKEPMVRAGGGKPHVVDECIRHGGRIMFIHTSTQEVITTSKYMKLPTHEKNYFRQGLVEAVVYVRGKVRHPDHKTLELQGWHVITPNTETRFSKAGAHVTMSFID